MSHKHLTLTVLVLLALLLSASTTAAQDSPPEPGVGAQAALGTAFTYQGYLAKGGSPVSDTCDFRFSLYNAQSSGAQVGPLQDKPGIAVTGGLFTVSLDFGGDVFTGDARWLETAVKCAGDASHITLSRQALAATPYALALPGLRTQQTAGSPNIIGGRADNSVTSGVIGATISGGGVSVAGGPAETNIVTDNYGTIGGGGGNQAGNNTGTAGDASFATVGGGRTNSASVEDATVSGGRSNRATSNQATIGGGEGNEASGVSSTIAGGWHNQATNSDATVGGGQDNQATGDNATVSGGSGNVASGFGSSVGGGWYNLASGFHATVDGGWGNIAGGSLAAVGGGDRNTANGEGAIVPGGFSNTAAGYTSFAAGRRAKANHNGAFVWADSTDAEFASTGANQFIVRASGGLWFGTNSSPSIPAGRFLNTSTGGYLSTGGVWTDNSDRNSKENFASLDGIDILNRLMGLPIQTWNYKAEDPSVRHIGPTAQDFYAAFRVGNDEAHLAALDTNGVALAAIQALYTVVQDQDAQIAAQQQQIADLEARLTALEQKVGGNNILASAGIPVSWLAAGALIAGVFWLGRRRLAGRLP